MGLCYDCGFRALTVALALGLPGGYPPLEGLGVTDQHGELAVVEQAQRAEQPTAGRDLLSFNARSAARSVRESVTGAAEPGGNSLPTELP